MIRNDGLLKDMKKVMDVQGLPPQKTLWTTPPFGYYKDNLCAQIAQPVEQRTENPCVGGSNPSLGTRKSLGFSLVFQRFPFIVSHQPHDF